MADRFPPLGSELPESTKTLSLNVILCLRVLVMNHPAAGSTTADMEPFDDGIRQSAPKEWI
jgi:hypothetical protein